MYCTTLHLHKRIIYRCVSLVLLASLLCYPFSPTQAQEAWHEELVPWPSRRWSRRRHRIVVHRFVFLGRWSLILFCRLGLMAALLLWSGWPQRQRLSWALLSLPLVDAILFLLPLVRPGVLKKRTYLPLARGVHAAYRLALVVLFGQGLSTASLCLDGTGQAKAIFEFLKHHYPKLVNAVENPLIPLTNNTVELVNRRFDQHYQNMCGFDSIETARTYLGLFELFYRFTPFARDNRPVKGRDLDIRGKCPLELAGYNICKMPIARILRAQMLGWPSETVKELVPCG